MRRPQANRFGQQGNDRSSGQFGDSRMGQGQGHMDTSRGGYDRGPGRFNRGNDDGDGRGWDDRRSGGGGGGGRGGDSYNNREDWGDSSSRGGGDGRNNHDGFRRGGQQEGGGGFADGGNRGRGNDRRSGGGGGGGRDESREPMLRQGPQRRGDNSGSSMYNKESQGQGRDAERKPRDGSQGSSPPSHREARETSDSGSVKRAERSGGGEPKSRSEAGGESSTRWQQRRQDSANKSDIRTSLHDTSPSGTRDESLASLFSQDFPQSTSTPASSSTTTSRRKTTKSFGGKKSPKKPGEDVIKGDKSKGSSSGGGGGSMASRLLARSRLILDNKKSSNSSIPSLMSGKTRTLAKETSVKSESPKTEQRDGSREKTSNKAQSTPESQSSKRTEDTNNSRRSQQTHTSSSSRRQSKSPEDSKRSNNRSPAPKRATHSRSPAPSSSASKERLREAPTSSSSVSSSKDKQHRDTPPSATSKDKTRDAPASSSSTSGKDRPRGDGPSSSSSSSKEKARAANTASPAAGSSRQKKDTSPIRDQERKPATDNNKSLERQISQSASEPEEASSSPPVKKGGRSSDNESLPAKLVGGDIVAAMLGDDGQADEKVFSDWSDDDDADNILSGGDSRMLELSGGMPEDLDYIESDTEPEPVTTSHRNPSRLLPFSSSSGYSTKNSGMTSNNMFGGGRDVDLLPFRKQDVDATAKGVEQQQQLQEQQQQRPPGVERSVLEKNLPNVKILEDVQREKPARERRRRDTEDEGYEEISSDENDLDEDGDRLTKRTIVGILDMDLASLMPACRGAKAAQTTGPVFQRFKAASVFEQIGLSRTLAGDRLFNKVKAFCQAQLNGMIKDQEQKESGDGGIVVSDNVTDVTSNKAETEVEGQLPLDQEAGASPAPQLPAKADTADSTPSVSQPARVVDSKAGIDIQVQSSSVIPAPSVDSKEEVKEPGTNKKEEEEFSSRQDTPAALPQPLVAESKETTEDKIIPQREKPVFELCSDAPSVHRLLKARARERTRLFNTSSILTRALTARKDLDIRRSLCNVPGNFDQSAVYPSGNIDPDLYSQCVQLFKQNRPPPLPRARLAAQCPS